MSNIAVVIPTIRKESYTKFRTAWDPLLKKHDVALITVWDGEEPMTMYNDHGYRVEDIMGSDADLIYNFNDGVRNLGFALIAKQLPEIETIITLDDDVEPVGDTIQYHLSALNMRVPTSWISTASLYTRGFPYGIRHDNEVVLSHGIWNGVKDWDAPTQLIHGNRNVQFYMGPIPKGIFYPMCIMNVAFKRKLLPYMYQAPMGPKVGIDRFADIWTGIESKKIIDEKGWAVVTGYAVVNHTRASDVFANLKKEVVGLSMNEHYGEDDYFKLYQTNRKRWEDFCGIQS